MTRTVIWRCSSDSKQHLATLTGNPKSGHQLRAFCGKVTDKIHFPELLVDGKVTCEQCRAEETIAALVKYLAA